MTRHLSLSLGIVLFLAGVHAGPAYAQDAPTRAFKGLFGGNERKPATVRQALDFRTEVQGGQDDNLLATNESSQMFDPRYQVGGAYGSTNMSLTYATATGGRAITFSGRAAGDLRYSPPALAALSDPQYDGALALGLQKTFGIMTLSSRQGASYSPYRVLTMFPQFAVEDGVPVAVTRDFAISSHQIYGLNSDGRIDFRLGRKSMFDLAYRRMMTDYASFGSKIVDESAGGTYSYRMTQHAAVRLGYSYRLASYSGVPGGNPIPSQNIDAGIDYNRPLSPTRKTSVTFSTGSSAASDGHRNTQYYAVGGAGVVQEIGRSWSARLLLNRSLSFLDGFANPYLLNGVNSNIGGYIGRRVDVVVNGAFADAASTLSAVRSRYKTYTGSAKLRFALSRYSSLYAQYFYYQYQFRGGNVIQGLPPMMERRGFRGGLTLWLPLVR